jgi:5'(3')-deoxyribonucleotidase
MRVEVSERINTRKDTVAVVSALEAQLRKIAKVTRDGNVITDVRLRPHLIRSTVTTAPCSLSMLGVRI